MTKVYLDELIGALIPILMMISALHFVLYETIRNPVANLLFQFIGVIGMGYISGYIYPSSFFPDGIAMVGKLLPTGIALESFSDAVLGERNMKILGVELLFFTVFMILSIWTRRQSIVRENR